MEDIVGLIVMAIIMIGGAVASANKKKKAREAAEQELRRRQQQQQQQAQQGDIEQEQGRFGNWSLEDVLAELTDQKNQEPTAMERDYPGESYYDRQTVALETDDRYAVDHSATDRSATYRSASDRFTPAAATPKAAITGRVAVSESPAENEPESIDAGDFLKDFDLRRAVIESEVLRPKFEQY